MLQKLIDWVIIIVLVLAILLLGFSILRSSSLVMPEAINIRGTVCGLGIRTEEECAVLCEGKTVVQHPARFWDILLFNGMPIAFDQTSNTCYISQPAGAKSFTGKFQTVHKDTSAYWIASAEEPAEESLRAGTLHQICICAPDSCTTVNVAFTTLPVVGLFSASDSGLTNDYSGAQIYLQDAEEGVEGGNVFSYALAKKSSSGETITLKLRKQGYTGKNRLTLAGMGQFDDWKLYAVDTGKPFHMMLAFQIWNACSEESGLAIPCRYVELVEDGAYQGLYILRPRANNEAFRKLNYMNEVLDTDDLDTDLVPHDLYQVYPPENLSDLGLYYEATFAFANLYDDTKVLRESSGKYYTIPGKPEYVFGDFPRRYNYMIYHFEDRMLNAADFGLKGESAESFDLTLRERWLQARDGFLSSESLQEQLGSFLEELVVSGYAARNGFFLTQAEWNSLQENNGAPQSTSLLGEIEQQLLDGLSVRFGLLDKKLEGQVSEDAA